MSRRSLDVPDLKKWQRWLANLENGEVEKAKDRILRTAAFRISEYLDDLTPRRTGDLVNSMKIGGKDNVFKLVVGQTSYVFVGTAVSYAQFVNDGFTQEAGRFVPGEWRSGTFHYIPGHNEGMVLTGKVIPGAHMFNKAMDYVAEDMPQIVEFEFRRLYRQLF
ncbi:HK97 gp10 family phage protein [Brevibacillus fulvus]|uniref:HK97 gp10 family phage protein n=1 Tax=Brevibacillus fulvus TaxID=1125967 RepID=A0A938XVZ3_9BACL|nr:HK97 gp10 family phage protein [Brevibacillus fulvus]MBM7591172.1 hypothetical protein [Brevibacillus fulvus]